MNERSGRKKERVSDFGGWDTPTSSSGSGFDSNTSSSWDSPSDFSSHQTSDRGGFSNDRAHSGGGSSWTSDFDRKEDVPWSSDNLGGRLNESDPWSQSRDLHRKRKRNSIFPFDLRDSKVILFGVGIVVLVALLAVFLYNNADGISSAFSALGEAFISALAMGILVVAIVYFISKKLRMNLKGKTLLWLFVIVAAFAFLQR